jgi:hypothetical protein
MSDPVAILYYFLCSIDDIRTKLFDPFLGKKILSSCHQLKTGGSNSPFQIMYLYILYNCLAPLWLPVYLAFRNMDTVLKNVNGIL